MTGHNARPRGLPLVAAVLLFVAAVVAVYWILFLSGTPALSEVPCYMTFQAAFPAADTWIAVAALVGGIRLLARKS
jgi:hypothetical protein